MEVIKNWNTFVLAKDENTVQQFDVSRAICLKVTGSLGRFYGGSHNSSYFHKEFQVQY